MSSRKEIIKSLCTISEMLTDRGVFDVANYINYSDAEVEAISNNKHMFHIDVTPISLRIVYNLGAKFRVNEVKSMLDLDNIKSYLFVSKEKINANELKKLQEAFTDYQFFELKELTFNITKHHYVPKHELIKQDDEVIKEIVSAYQIKTKSQLPLILKADPMAKYLNAKPGDIVKITRYSPTAGEHVVYRCCV